MYKVTIVRLEDYCNISTCFFLGSYFGSVANICNSKQEVRNRRRLATDEVTIRVGNGLKVDVMAIGTLSLVLPSGLVLNLNKCYYVLALSMKIISRSCLLKTVIHLSLRIIVVLFI
jgi:hypothetical protein